MAEPKWSKKWTNYGDMDHRESGGCFVKVDEDREEVEVVKVEPIEDDTTGKRTGYAVDVQTYYFDDIRQEFHPGSGCWECFDWRRFEEREIDDIWDILASDMINYYGGATDLYTGPNYWELLKPHGVTPKNIRKD